MAAARSGIASKHPATAHIPGLGPVGARCTDCQHFSKEEKKQLGVCAKATEFRGGSPVRTVHYSTSACKYFERVVKAASP